MQKQLKRLTGIFLAMSALIVAGIVITFIIGQVVIENNRGIISQLQTDEDLRQFHNRLLEAESGQRGFLLTGNESYLSRYQAAIRDTRKYLDTIDQLGREGRISPAAAGEIHHLTRQKIADMDATIDVWRRQGPEAALQMVNTGAGAVRMGKIHELLNEIDAQHQQTVQREQVHAEESTMIRNVVFTTVGLLNMIFLAWLYRRVSDEMQHRDRARALAEEQRELLNVTLRSIGDAVIVTDTLGQVTFMNDVAQKLTGITEEQARGKPVSAVFRVVREGTHELVESPVQKVLRDGRLTAMADHTLLIRPDGSELPIDNSGAPVRDRNGHVHGVVLVFRDFTEHRKNQAALREARTRAEHASQAKDQFMAALSHELRTPLTPVLAMLTNWEDHHDIPEAHRHELQMMRRNIELEARLIDDLLDLTRVIKGKLAIHVERSDVHDILHHVEETCRSEANAKHVKVEMHLDAREHVVMADPARLQQIFWNILRNATKFSRERGRVVVSTANAPDHTVEVAVVDEGIGMEPELIQRLYRPFEQGGAAITRRYGGLGLGLAISKALVDLQGGQLVAESGGPGKGSRFVVRFPPAAPSVDGEPRPKAQSQISQRDHKLKILLVEDHPDTAKTMARLLGNLGHEVRTAGTVAGALEAARQNPPDLVLSDIGLPDGDGVEFLTKLREFSDVPAIALTGFGMDEDVSRTTAAGFRAHLTKPVNFQRLEVVIQQMAAFGGASRRPA